MRTSRTVQAAAAVAVTLATLTLVSACADERIVLATLPPSSGSTPPGEGQRCVEDDGCGPNAYCARKHCDDIGGACEARPIVCDEDPAPVCGCDGITYWNDCVRRAAGTTAMTDGECSSGARLCGVFPSKPPQPGGPPGGPPDPGGPEPGVEPCPKNTFCARLLPPSPEELPPPPPPPSPQPPIDCPGDAPGTCWALPAVCPTVGAGPDRWLSCGPPDGCKTTCEAIRTGEPHRRAKTCQ